MFSITHNVRIEVMKERSTLIHWVIMMMGTQVFYVYSVTFALYEIFRANE